MSKVLVAMSGGVDSSVAALLLVRRGVKVAGVTMRLDVAHTDKRHSECCGPEAVTDASRVCDKLGISHYVLDLTHQLERTVIEPFVSAYRSGRTPNPCILCNRHLKFGALLNFAIENGFDVLATGHYARITRGSYGFQLERATDKAKDQSYFLYGIPREALSRVIFPIGELTKGEVRRVAREANLPVAEKKESQDICFTTEYRRFLASRFRDTPGWFVDTNGKKLGRHHGVSSYTIGQRKGLGISGRTPLYVVAIHPHTNTVVLGQRHDLLARTLRACHVNLLVESVPRRVVAMIRSTHRPAAATVSITDDTMDITFDTPQEAITPGQSVVLYEGDVVLGGGIIECVTA